MDKRLTTLSKFLALCLRHKPETIGIVLDEDGWCNLDEFIRKSNEFGTKISLDDIKIIVEENNKKRYSISDDGSKIRANQGHSLKEVDIKFEERTPPRFLYHGTSCESRNKIFSNGKLSKMNRNHVHLSDKLSTAVDVAKRHSKNISILIINTEKLIEMGHVFYISDNGVWLSDDIEVSHITAHDW